MNKRPFLDFLGSILLVALFASFVEAFTYSGFLLKHFNIWIGIFFLVLTVVTFLISRGINKTALFGNIMTVFTILTTLVYFILRLLENIMYSNYVFSHFHVHLELLLLCLLILSVSLFWLGSGGERVNFVLRVVILFILIDYIVAGFNSIENGRPIFILKNLGLTNVQKMEMAMGKTFYDYTIFLKENTQEDSIVLIPPQGFPWSQTGNSGYLRYFLYPRTLVNGGENEPGTDLNSVDYVLIDYGETTISEYGYTNIWPKFDISGEYIIYWDPQTGKTWRDDGGIYTYKKGDSAVRWGILKIKK